MSELNSTLFSPLLRTNDIQRYSSTKLVEGESLGQHITDVTMISYIIAKRLIHEGESINLGLLLENCLVHDLDEIGTGDVPRNTKYALPGIKDLLDEVSTKSIIRMSSGLLGMEDLHEVWNYSKSDAEGYILKLADMLCVVRKAKIEVEIYNNLNCLKLTHELTGHLRDLSSTSKEYFETQGSINYLDELISGSIHAVEILNSKHSDICERFSITKNII